MSLLITLLFALIVSLASWSPKAWAQPPCTADGDVCNGDVIYVWEGAADGKLKTGVARIDGQGAVSLLGSKGTLDRARVASTHPNACYPKDGKLCVGTKVREKSGKTSEKPSTLAAVFPTGYVVVKAPNGKLQSVRHEGYEVVSDPALTAAAQKAQAASKALTEGTVPARSPCPSCDAPDKPGKPGKPNDPLAPESLRRKSSFARFILDHPESKLAKSLGPSCLEFLTQIYRSGNTLYSAAAVASSKTIDRIAFPSRGRRTDFFHYTNSKAMLDQFHPEITDRKEAHRVSLVDGTYDRMVLWPKEHTDGSFATKYYRIYDGVLYVAEDPESSKSYGLHRVTFHLNPKARIIQLACKYESGPSPETPLYRDIGDRFPGIWNVCNRHLVQLFIVEDSGIDLIDYENDSMWFQLIRPNAIERVELQYSPE